jgi:Putative MetA-pathway of phenol degradation
MKLTVFALFAFALLLAPPGFTQELTPRAYWPAPQGTRIATIGYSYVSGDTIPDPSLPVSGVDSKIHTLQLGYLHTFNLRGRTANVILALPYSEGDTVGADEETGSMGKRDYQGIGDVSATLSVNFMGAPSMTPQQFSEYRQNPKPILGGSLKVVAPTGKYDTDKVINVGANRWAMKAELGFIAPLTDRWLMELDLGTWLFADNPDFVGFTKEQKPLTSLQAHLVRRVSQGWWVSLDASYYTGGRSTLDGNRLNDLQRDSKWGFTVVYPVARKHAVKFGYNWGSLIDSDENFNVFSVSYSKVF